MTYAKVRPGVVQLEQLRDRVDAELKATRAKLIAIDAYLAANPGGHR